MRVAGNHDVNATGGWIDLQFPKVMQDVEGTLPEPQRQGVGIIFGPFAGIDISSDRSNRRNLAKCGQNIGTTDIPGVDDMRHAGKPLLSLWPQEPVGIRNDSDLQHCAVLCAVEWGVRTYLNSLRVCAQLPVLNRIEASRRPYEIGLQLLNPVAYNSRMVLII